VGSAQLREEQGAGPLEGYGVALLQQGGGHNAWFRCARAETAGVLCGL